MNNKIEPLKILAMVTLQAAHAPGEVLGVLFLP